MQMCRFGVHIDRQTTDLIILYKLQHNTFVVIMLRNGFGTGAGCGRSAGKERKRIGSGSEELRSGREAEGLGFNSCVAPSCTQVSYFGKADRTEKETGGTEVDIQTV